MTINTCVSTVSGVEMKSVSPRNNVVNLRKSNEDLPISTIEDSIQVAKQARIELSHDMTEIAMEQLMGFLTGYGVLKEMHKVDGRDLIMIENSIQAAIYRHYGLEHPLHDVTEEVFDFADED